jgi:hypothetical protein
MLDGVCRRGTDAAPVFDEAGEFVDVGASRSLR